LHCILIPLCASSEEFIYRFPHRLCILQPTLARHGIGAARIDHHCPHISAAAFFSCSFSSYRRCSAAIPITKATLTRRRLPQRVLAHQHRCRLEHVLREHGRRSARHARHNEREVRRARIACLDAHMHGRRLKPARVRARRRHKPLLGRRDAGGMVMTAAAAVVRHPRLLLLLLPVLRPRGSNSSGYYAPFWGLA
jgi:hypothetical protein